MSFEDQIRISTPEGVDLELTLAGLGSRLGAGFIDFVIRWAVYLALGLMAGGISAATGRTANAVAFGIFIALVFLIEIGYDIAFEVLGSGRTIGKRVMGTRVLRTSGAPVDFRSSAVRNLLRLIDGPLTGYLLGVLAILFSPRNQRIGDMVAGTVVARDRIEQARTTEIHYAFATSDPRAWDVGAVTREHVGTLRRFLERRDSLEPLTRNRLARELYERVRPMVGGAVEQLSPEAFLEEVVRIKSASDR